jgi:PAS domain S-box-containing protein
VVVSFVVVALLVLALMAWELAALRDDAVADAQSQMDVLTQDFVRIIALGSVDDAADVVSKLRAFPQVRNVYLFDDQGAVRFQHHAASAQAVPLPTRLAFGHRFTAEYLEVYRPLEYGGGVYGAAYFRVSLARFNGRVSMFLMVGLLLLGAFILSAVALNMILRRSLSEPVVSLSQEVGSITESGDYSRRLTSGRDDEIGAIQLGVNKLLDTVESATRGLERSVRERTEELASSEHRFRILVENAPDAFFLHDRRGRLLDVNEEACRSLGYTREELLSLSVFDLATDVPRDELVVLWSRMGEGETMSLEGGQTRRDGSSLPVSVKVTHFTRAGQDFFVALVRDITAQKQQEQALQRAVDEARSANRAKSEFLSSMSHELRTPLNAILGFAQLLQMQVKDERQLSQITEIRKAGDHLLALITDVLDLARIDSGKMALSLETVNLAGLLQECHSLIKPMCDDKGVRLVPLECPDVAVHVTADRTRLKQALLNLLSNAVKYNRPDGQVRMDCVPGDGGRMRIRVEDTGLGIAEKDQEALFQAFERLGHEASGVEGTGIGLVITQRLMVLMGGMICMQSREGEGSVFWVEIPLAPPQAGTQRSGETPPVQEKAASTHASILYIEDNPANMQLVVQALQGLGGYRVLQATSGQDGLELARRERPGLILLDINLPGMDGYEVMRQLQADPVTRDIPVVAVTANAMENDREKGMQAGFAQYVTKPIDVAALLQTVMGTLPP